MQTLENRVVELEKIVTLMLHRNGYGIPKYPILDDATPQGQDEYNHIASFFDHHSHYLTLCGDHEAKYDIAQEVQA